MDVFDWFWMWVLDGWVPDEVGAWCSGWTDSEGGEALLLYWIVRHFCWCENPLRHFCWWGSESCLLIGQNLISESYVMIGQSWAMSSDWSELDDWILLEFSNLNCELPFFRTWWDNSSWDFWLNRASWLARILFPNPTCWLVRTCWSTGLFEILKREKRIGAARFYGSLERLGARKKEGRANDLFIHCSLVSLSRLHKTGWHVVVKMNKKKNNE